MTEATVISSDPAVKADLNGTSSGDANKPTEVEIKLGDKTVKVDPAVAEALEAARNDAAKNGADLKTLNAQLQEMAGQIAALRPQPKKEGAQPEDLSVQIFTDPDKAIQRIVQTAVAQSQAIVQQSNAQKEFWDEFYRQNSDLKEFDGYVRYVFQRELPGYTKQNLTVGDTLKKIAETVKGDMVKMAPKGGTGKKVVAEGGNEGDGNKSGKGSSKDVSGDETVTTRGILAERAEARRQARQPGRGKSK